MKVIVLALAFAGLTAGAAAAQDSHYVNGYTRKDGTYVAPHMSANPGTYSNDVGSSYLSTPSRQEHESSGYTNRSGTYVAPYAATNPNTMRDDNYSTRGNVNPYTGRPGTKPRDGDLFGGF